MLGKSVVVSVDITLGNDSSNEGSGLTSVQTLGGQRECYVALTLRLDVLDGGTVEHSAVQRSVDGCVGSYVSFVLVPYHHLVLFLQVDLGHTLNLSQSHIDNGSLTLLLEGYSNLSLSLASLYIVLSGSTSLANLVDGEANLGLCACDENNVECLGLNLGDTLQQFHGQAFSIYLAGVLHGSLDFEALGTEGNGDVGSGYAEGSLRSVGSLHGQRSCQLGSLVLVIFHLSGNIQIACGQTLCSHSNKCIASLTSLDTNGSGTQCLFACSQSDSSILHVSSTGVLHSHGDVALLCTQVNRALDALDSHILNLCLSLLLEGNSHLILGVASLYIIQSGSTSLTNLVDDEANLGLCACDENNVECLGLNLGDTLQQFHGQAFSIYLAGVLHGSLDFEALGTEGNGDVGSGYAEGSLRSVGSLHGQRSCQLGSLVLVIFHLSGNIQIACGQTLCSHSNKCIASLTSLDTNGSGTQCLFACSQSDSSILHVSSTGVLHSHGNVACSSSQIDSTLNSLNSQFSNRSLHNHRELSSSLDFSTANPSLQVVRTSLGEVINFEGHVLVGICLQTPDPLALTNLVHAIQQLHFCLISLSITCVLHVHHNLYLSIGGQHLNIFSGNGECRSGSGSSHNCQSSLLRVVGRIHVALNLNGSSYNQLTGLKTFRSHSDGAEACAAILSSRYGSGAKSVLTGFQCNRSVGDVNITVVHYAHAYIIIFISEFERTQNLSDGHIGFSLFLGFCNSNVDVATILVVGGQSLDVVVVTGSGIGVGNGEGQFLSAVNLQSISCLGLAQLCSTLDQLNLSSTGSVTNILNIYLNGDGLVANFSLNVLSSQLKLGSSNRSGLHSQGSRELCGLVLVEFNGSGNSQLASLQTFRSNCYVAEALLSGSSRNGRGAQHLLTSLQRNRSIGDINITLVLHDNAYIA